MRNGLIIFVALWCAGCQSEMRLGGSLWGATPESDALAGTRAAQSVEARYGGVHRDAATEERLARIGEALIGATAELHGTYTFRLLNTDTCNAVSLPGGRVYLTRGLLARLDSDRLIAAVLAHEMAHIATRDHFKRRCATCGEALDRESAADVRALGYLQHAGYAPEALVDVLRIIRDIQPEGWSDSRIRTLAPHVNQQATLARG